MSRPKHHPDIVCFQSGQDRNEKPAARKTHTYATLKDGTAAPMCGYGWNRRSGIAFSVFRGEPGTEGDCKVCQKNLKVGKLPIIDGWPHPTKWL